MNLNLYVLGPGVKGGTKEESGQFNPLSPQSITDSFFLLIYFIYLYLFFVYREDALTKWATPPGL